MLQAVTIKNYVGHKSNASYLFPWKLHQIQRAQEHYLIEQILSYKMLFFNTDNLHHWRWLLSLPPLLKNTSLCSHLLFGVHKHSASSDECQWMPFFPHGGIQWYPSGSSTLPRQPLFCQIAPLLPSVIWQQHAMGYWWEDSASTAIPPTSNWCCGPT